MGIMELIGEGHEGLWSIYLCIEFAQLPANVYVCFL